MIQLHGKVRIGTWVPAWYLSRAVLMSMYPTKAEVHAVVVASWKRSTRTDWVWRLRDREYPDNYVGGTCDTAMGGGWDTELFATEIEAWAYAVGWCRTRLHQRQAALAQEVAQYADAMGEASVGLSRARDRAVRVSPDPPTGAEGGQG